MGRFFRPKNPVNRTYVLLKTPSCQVEVLWDGPNLCCWFPSFRPHRWELWFVGIELTFLRVLSVGLKLGACRAVIRDHRQLGVQETDCGWV